MPHHCHSVHHLQSIPFNSFSYSLCLGRIKYGGFICEMCNLLFLKMSAHSILQLEGPRRDFQPFNAINHTQLLSTHASQELGLRSKVKLQGGPGNKGGGCSIPDRSWVLGAWWCVEWGKGGLMPSVYLFLLPPAKSRTPKLRAIPLKWGRNFCMLSESQFHNLERKIISTEQWSITCVYIIYGQNTFFEYRSTVSAFLLLT